MTYGSNQGNVGNNQMSTSQLTSWLQTASADDVITVSKSLFTRINSLDQSDKARVTREFKNNPQANSLFNTPQHDTIVS
jgi:hypothetical protein